MTARIYIYKIGPFEDGDSIYVPIGEDNGKPTDLDPVVARDDLAGVRGIVAQREHEVLVCETALEAAARACGLEVEELPAMYVSARVDSAMGFALNPIRDFYRIEVMPRFAKRAAGKYVLADDEDVLVMAGVVAALASFTSLELLCWADLSTPGREVRTYISAGLPFPFVEL